MRPLTPDEIICLCGLASVLAVAIYAHLTKGRKA
jgi:hypothetical protein